MGGPGTMFVWAHARAPAAALASELLDHGDDALHADRSSTLALSRMLCACCPSSTTLSLRPLNLPSVWPGGARVGLRDLWAHREELMVEGRHGVLDLIEGALDQADVLLIVCP